jgi:O-antigen/teichoic acid export membrane protein
MSEKSNLKKKAVSGVLWTSISKFSAIGIRFISGIVLARLLKPEDYGCIGMLSIFMVVARSFVDCGFASALIQKKRPTQEDYSTIFFFNLSMSSLMYAILFLCAPAIARFYKISLLSSVLRVQGLILIIDALSSIHVNQLKKTFRFQKLTIVDLVTSVTSLVICIFMAYKGFGVWALVSMNLTVAIIPTVIFWVTNKWFPLLVFSIDSFRELFKFGSFMFLSHLVNQIGAKISQLLIGKIYSPAVLGYYTKAVSTESLASHSISSVLTQITYPLYAEVQDNKTLLGNMIKRLTQTIAYITFPLMSLLIIIAKPVFLVLYSARWLPSVPYFQVLCICGIVTCLQAVNTQSIAAIGKSRTMFGWTLLKRSTGSTLVVGGLLLWGMKGLLAGYFLYICLCYFVNIGLVSKYIGYKWQRQLLDLAPTLGAVFTISLITYYSIRMLHLTNDYLDGLLKGIVFIVLFLGWSLIFKPDSYQYTLSLVPSKFKFWERKQK